MKALSIISAVLLLTACSYNVKPKTTYGGYSVKRMYNPPETKEYISHGLHAWGFYRPGNSPPTLNDVWPELSSKVRAIGGNACVVKDETVSALSARSIEVTCDVITIKRK